MEMTGPMKIYLEEIDLIPILTRDDEKKFIEMVRNGKEEGKLKLQERSLRLVVTIASEYEGLTIPVMDLIQEGNIGLMMAVDSFDYNGTDDFSSYISVKIKESIEEYIKDQGEDIKIPASLAEKMQKVQNTKEELEAGDKHIVTDAEIASKLSDVSSEEVSRILEFIKNPNELKALADSGEDFFEDTKEPEEDDKEEVDIVEEAVDSLVRKEEVANLMSVLTDEEKNIISLRFGLGREKPADYSEIAEITGTPEEQVKVIEENAMNKLRIGASQN